MNDDGTPAKVRLNVGLDGDAPNWGGMFAALMIQGIAAKIQQGESLTAAQQALKDAAPHGFKWPEPPNAAHQLEARRADQLHGPCWADDERKD